MPNEQPSGRIVDLSVKMKPSAHLRVMAPHQRAQEVEPGAFESADECTPEHRGTQGGLMIMRILTMSDTEKRAAVADQVGDPLVVWFALLSPAERKQFLAAAERDIKSRITEG